MKALQYLSDAQGRHTAVVIPIEEWNSMVSKYRELRELEHSPRKPSDFFGTLNPNEGEKIQA